MRLHFSQSQTETLADIMSGHRKDVGEPDGRSLTIETSPDVHAPTWECRSGHTLDRFTIVVTFSHPDRPGWSGVGVNHDGTIAAYVSGGLD